MIAGNILFLMLINALTMPTYLLTMKERRLQICNNQWRIYGGGSSDTGNLKGLKIKTKIKERWIQRQRNQVMKQKPPNVIEIEKEFTGNQPKIKLNISYYVAGYLTLLYWKLEKDPEKLLGYEIDIDDVSLIKSVWKSNKPLIVVTHGWIDYYDESGVYSIKNTYAFKYPDQYNIITVGWATEYEKKFLDVASNCKPTGLALSKFLILLVNMDLIAPSNIHMIGHNLGAHVLGVCGANFQKLTQKKIGRITGLNPSGPMSMYQWEKQIFLRKLLQKDDAEFVDLIHTAKIYKFPSTTGHVEFYPNGGKSPQPGCEYENLKKEIVSGDGMDDGTKYVFELYCSDARSYEYYNESITNESVFVSEFNDELNEPNTNQITKNKNLLTNSMGHNVNKSNHGKFSLKTKDESPFNNS